MLPHLHRGKLREMFDTFDDGLDECIDANALLKWMIDARKESKEIDSWMSGSKNTGGSGVGMNEEKAQAQPTFETASKIIDAHDDNGDGVLQWSEFERWVAQGSILHEKDRRELRQ